MVNARHRDNFLFFLIVLEVFLTMTPIMGYLLSPVIHIVFWGVITLYIIFGRSPDYTNLQKSVLWLALGYLIVIFAYKFLEVSDASWGNYLNQIRFFMPLLLTFVVFFYFDTFQIKTLMTIVLLIVALNIADGIRIVFENPAMNYMLLYDNIIEDTRPNLNVGDSDFFTMVLVFFNVSLLAFFNTKKSFGKNVYLLFAALSLFFIIFVALKATVLIYALLSFVLLLIARRHNHPGRFILVAAFVSVFLLLLIKPIIYFLVDIVGDERIAERLLIFVGDSMGNQDAMTARKDVYTLSVRTWLSSPLNFLFGIGDHRAAFDAAFTGIGQHSTFLDTLARYGLLGSLILYRYFKHLFKWMSEVCDENIRMEFYSVVIIIIICGFSKELFSPSCGMAINFLLPLCLISISNKNIAL